MCIAELRDTFSCSAFSVDVQNFIQKLSQLPLISFWNMLRVILFCAAYKSRILSCSVYSADSTKLYFDIKMCGQKYLLLESLQYVGIWTTEETFVFIP